MTRRSILLIFLLPCLLVLSISVFSFGRFYLRPVAPAEPVLVEIPAGTPFLDIAERLQAAGVISDAKKFRLLARLRGDIRRPQAGEYGFVAPATPAVILDRLIAGDVQRRRITIPEGLTVREIARRLDAEGIAAAGEIERLARSADFLATLGVGAASLEGYLFPETYQYVGAIEPASLLRSMVRQFEQRLTPEILAAARNRGLTRHQLVTLASIVQKEAGNEKEMPLIAGVFHNRLRLRMPLQADPTVIYGITDFDGNLTRQHLLAPTPYNTYRIAGLPPGPIANPGLAALQAAAFPAPVNYLYFVARGDGTHYFSSNLREHNEAVRRFQLRRR